MSMEHPSQPAANPFADPAIPTLAGLLERVSASSELTETTKTARKSAIRTVARAIGLPLAAIPAHPGFLGKKLADVSPARIGLKSGSWANAKSLLAKALREQGIDVMPGRYLAPIAPSWLSLWKQMPERPHKIALSRFVRYCSTRGIAPDGVTEQVFADFDAALLQESFVESPETVCRNARRFWNEVGDIISDWPDLRVAVPDRRVRYKVSLSEFPATLAEELAEYEAALTANVLDARLDAKPIKPVSAQSKIEILRRIASAAVVSGMSPSDLPDLRSLVRPEVVRQALGFIRERNGADKLKSFDTMLAHVISTARHWVKVAADEVDALANLKRRLDIDTYEMSTATRDVLRDVDRPETLRSLITLPGRLFEEAERQTELKRTRHVRLQVGVAVAVLFCAPIRPKNLAALRLDRHLIEVGAGRARRRHLRIPGDEVKNGEDLEFPLPDRVNVLLDRYLDEVRPHLAAPGNPFLFPGEDQGHKGAGLLSQQIAELTEARVGVRITAHKFRAIAGKILLDQNPTGQEIVRQVLGHKDITTTTTYYAPLQRDRAVALYDAALKAAGKEAEEPA